MHKKFLFPLFFLMLSIACKSKKEDLNKKSPAQPTLVDVLIVKAQSLSSNIEVNGSVVANEYVELHPEVSGRLTYLNVPEGKFIQQGTVIARINDADLQAQLNKTKVLLDLAVKNEERLRKLLAIKGINEADYDAALNTVNGYKADMAYTQSLIDKTIVKAPFSGLIGLRQVSPGAYLTPANIIATIQQLDKIKIDFTIPEEYSNLIKIGNTVTVELDASKGVTASASIIAIEPMVNQITRNLKVRTILQSGKANPGAYVKVIVSAGTDKTAMLVPTSAIIQDDKNKQLIVVKNGKANFITVETGVRQADNVEITKGINMGDSIVVTGVLFARPKSVVQIRSIKTLDQLAN